MKTGDLITETVAALSANKARSGLTILGIVIGISSVIVMVALGQGAQTAIQTSIQSIGSNLVIVMSGAQRGLGGGVSGGRGSAQTLTLGDATAIAAQVEGVRAVAPEVSGRYQVTARGTNTSTTVTGTTPDYTDVRNVQIDEGSFFSSQQASSGAKVAVLGPSVRDDLFGVGGDALGSTVRINRITFTIIGIAKTKGGSGFSNPDDLIFVPLVTAQRYLSGTEYVSLISVAARDAASTTPVQEALTALLLDRHNIAEAADIDFNTLNQSDIVETATGVTQTLTLLLGSVAGISLLVGGIGIMNMMLTTVTERTREIGLRKAIGARPSDISIQFLAEAVALTFLGGTIGILLGIGVSLAVSSLGFVQATVSPVSILLAFGVSAAIGIAFGWYPARRAAKLSPIDALRYE